MLSTLIESKGRVHKLSGSLADPSRDRSQYYLCCQTDPYPLEYGHLLQCPRTVEREEHHHARRKKQHTISGLEGGGVMTRMTKFFLRSTVLLIMASYPTLSDRFLACELAGMSNFHLIFDQLRDDGGQGSVVATRV